MRRSWLRIVIAVAPLALVLIAAAYTAVIIPRGVPVADGSVLVIAAHPDDETYGMAQTIATQEAAGNRVAVVVLTDGESSGVVPTWTVESGEDLDSDGDIDRYDFGLARRAEFARAAKALGVDEVTFYGVSESGGQGGLRDGQLTAGEVRPLVRELLNTYRPAMVVAPAPYLGANRLVGDARNHPDHTAVAQAVRNEAAGRVAVWYAKIYEYAVREGWRRVSTYPVKGSDDARAAKREAVDAYVIGKRSTPDVWAATRADEREYLVGSLAPWWSWGE